jgi:hypothetical protein
MMITLEFIHLLRPMNCLKENKTTNGNAKKD